MLEPNRIKAQVREALQSGHPIRLTKALDLIAKLPQDDPMTWDLMTRVYLGLKHWDEAVASAQRAFEVSRGSEYHAAFFADVLMVVGELEAGMAMLEEMVAAGAKLPPTFLALSQRYIVDGRIQDAQRIQDRAWEQAAITGLEHVLLVHQAVAYILSDDIGRAKEVTLQALNRVTGKAYPDFAGLPLTAVAALRVEQVPEGWFDPLAKTIVSWHREESAGVPSHIHQIWSSELLQALPFDDEPITADEASAVEAGREALRTGDLSSLDDLERELGLL